MKRHAVVFGLLFLLTATPALAQDVYVPPSTSEYADALLHSRLTGRMIRQAQERRQRSPAARATSARTSAVRARATCSDKRRIAARLSAIKARRLYSLCAQAGY